jgi:acyl carrier protein|tara:strand:+ start:765 stop:1028 length:264 start_codon:yes stop_codon:yes gene_type:complete
MSTNEQMISELKEIVKPYIQNQEGFNNLTEETDFINDLKINSANLVDVVLDIEDKFDIEIDNDSMDKMLNVKAALEIIKTKLSENSV